jgi:hypothetical protein
MRDRRVRRNLSPKMIARGQIEKTRLRPPPTN